MFNDHLAMHPKTKVNDILTDQPDCSVTIKSVGVQIRYYRLIYCERCHCYMCTKCRFGTSNMVSEDAHFSHSQTCNYPANFVTYLVFYLYFLNVKSICNF